MKSERLTQFYNMCSLLVVCPLKEKQIILILRRYFSGLTLKEIAKDYNCSREAIRAYIDNALKIVKQHYKRKDLLRKINLV